MDNYFTKDTINKLNYYVYRLVDPRDGNTFYVGKGKNNRVFDHAKGNTSFMGKYEDEVSLKIAQINEIKSSGLDVIYIIHRHGMSEQTAFEVESALIDCYPNLTNIQSGHHSDRGLMTIQQIKERYESETFDDSVDIEFAVIKVTNQSIEMNNNDRYEATRGEWKNNLKNAIKHAEYVLSCTDGIVKAVYKVDEWYESKKIPGRIAFRGKEATDNIRKMFVGKTLPGKYTKKHAASPVLYHSK